MENKRNYKINIISIWLGILIPIIAALIPFLINWASPNHDLKYEIYGPIKVNDNDNLSIKILNEGEEVEEDIEIYIDRFNLNYANNNQDENIIIDSKTKIKIITDKNYYLLKTDDLRPEDTIQIDLSVKDAAIYSYEIGNNVKVKSKKHVAHLEKQSDIEKYIHMFGFWMFILLMILILFAGIYQEYLMDPKKREKLLWDELEKIQRRLNP